MIKIFFTYDDRKIMLPVNPPNLLMERSGANQKEEIVKLGKINILRTPELASMELTGFFPAAPNAPWVLSANDFRSPASCIEFFETVWFAKKPMEISFSDMEVSLTDTGAAPGTKPMVSIEEFSCDRRGGDADVYYKLGLLEYKPFRSKAINTAPVTVDGQTMAVREPEREETRSVPATHTVIPGDTLCNIALKYYGDDGKHKDIAKANNIANPNVIHAGQVLKLP
jgi:hypothetical protein